MNTDPRDNQFDYIEFPAPSAEAFAAAKRFYQEAFGWQFQDWAPDYADSRSSGITTGLSGSAEHRPSGALPVLFCTDLEAARERVRRAGGSIVRDIFSFPGGRRFEYVDPAGNRLGVWSDRGCEPVTPPHP